MDSAGAKVPENAEGVTDMFVDDLGHTHPLVEYKVITSSMLEYPICRMNWGYPGMEPKVSLSALDLGIFAAEIYGKTEKDIVKGVLGGFAGTDLFKGMVLEHLADFNESGRWAVWKIPAAKTRVIAVRGTTTFQDALVDADLWAFVKILQSFDKFSSIISMMRKQLVRELTGSISLRAWLHEPRLWQALEDVAAKAKDDSLSDGWATVVTGHSLGGGLAQIIAAAPPDTGSGVVARWHATVVTGHSLGGGLAQIIAAHLKIPALVWSPVGVGYSLDRFRMTAEDVYLTSVLIQPDYDLVPEVDLQLGYTQHIPCHFAGRNPIECHSILRSECELFAMCGDPRGRGVMDEHCGLVIPEWNKTKDGVVKSKMEANARMPTKSTLADATTKEEEATTTAKKAEIPKTEEVVTTTGKKVEATARTGASTTEVVTTIGKEVEATARTEASTTEVVTTTGKKVEATSRTEASTTEPPNAAAGKKSDA
eukprot:CAMPEP_0203978160 /NCGR_PEP_ID=MMETSP0359-20131031/101975_1 /ASSEMBLY_ACC=CAM_ASM_000338 /TAXON_ID=268821 /ORGANISM="Scrippsiella Hangoei, Strain SHTV-5" /LENGTH=480 /DNA_ID=CAMNT_0050916369 /DNA_START=56 /DNA_END=1497 /DNA_ORIENTATION=+